MHPSADTPAARLPMRGKTCLVTGAASGIGHQTALGLCQMGATVLLVARDQGRGDTAVADIRHGAPQGSVELFVADLRRQHDVRDLARQVLDRHERVDVLVNNAAAVNSVRRVTPEGIEATLAVNHLAPYLLTRLLEASFRAAGTARVVTVSSYLHKMVNTIPWDDLQSETAYRSHGSYNLTKLFNVLFTHQLAARWSGTHLTANSLHPGWPLKTDLGREEQGAARAFDRLSKLFGASAAKGARTSLFLASSPTVSDVTGGYFANCKPAKPSTLAHDQAAANRLWQVSAELCGIAA